MTNGGFNGFPQPDSRFQRAGASFPVGYLRSGSYYWANSPTTGATSSTLGVGTLRLTPWQVPNSCLIVRIGAAVTSGGDSGSKFRLGIYSDDGTGYPGSLLLDAGTIAGDSATVQEITVAQALTAGLYWIGGAVQVVSVTQPTIGTGTQAPTIVTLPLGGASAPATSTNSFGVSQASVTGALPAVFSSSITVVGQVPRIFVKTG